MDGDQILMKKYLLCFAAGMFFVVFAACGNPQFDQERAFNDLHKICEFGPRIANTEEHLACGQFIYEQLKLTTEICRIQEFTVYDSLFGIERKMFNIVASFYPDSKKRIMLCAHWDSRPISDRDPDTTKYNLPILGANDGASGVAVLLEMSRILKNNEPPVGVDIVLFDGEDYGSKDWPGGWLIGSKYFAENLGGYRPRLAILIDMIGDADLNVYREGISEMYAKDLNDYIWTIAKEIGSPVFIDAVKDTITDDHVSLLSKGVKTIDIIDIDYPYWHTQEDTPDKCSAESLGEIGKVLIAAIFDERISKF